MTWFFHNTAAEVKPEDVEGYYGFVYGITEIATGKKYIGRKYLTKAKTTQVKGKKKRTRVKSDWEDYYGSNAELLKEIENKGKELFVREILHLCKTRSECSYFETYEIFARHALLSDNYWNAWVTCKIRKDHLKHLIEKPDTDTYKIPEEEITVNGKKV
jgi:hypothetical protein